MLTSVLKDKGIVIRGFVYKFKNRFPASVERQSWGSYKDQPLVDVIIDEAASVIAKIEQFKQLPERNQQVLLGMASFMITEANEFVGGDWKGNYWGLYIVGSRARGEAKSDSDLDLLSVGTYYRDLGFQDRFGEESKLFSGFGLEIPDELPDEYNVGEVDRKYLVRATPEDEGVLPIDLNVVDLTFTGESLDDFKDRLDVDGDGKPLPRLTLAEITVPRELNDL